MQLRQFRVPVSLAFKALLVEDLGELLDRLALPGRNLSRMQFVLARQLRNRLVALDRLKCDLGLELPRKPSPRPHDGSSSASCFRAGSRLSVERRGRTIYAIIP